MIFLLVLSPGLSPHSNGSDCGYSSSMEGSETGSREGSDVACTDGICNHEAGWSIFCCCCVVQIVMRFSKPGVAVICLLFFVRQNVVYLDRMPVDLLSHCCCVSCCHLKETTCVVTIIITVMKTRRTGYTAVWSAGLTLKKTRRARKIIKERTMARYVTIR